MSAPHYADDQIVLYAGDCLDILAELADSSVDAVVTDPPYGLEFMGKDWDSFRGDAWRNAAAITRTGYRDAERLVRPSFGGGDTANPTCATCGGRKRGARKCVCAEPAWRVKGEPLNARDNNAAQMRAFQDWCQAWAVECLRVLKPGGHMLAFGGTRTWHRLTCAIEDAGFEIRDSIAWLYGSGFPKSLDVSKAIDKAAGATREIVGTKLGQPGYSLAPNDNTGRVTYGTFGDAVSESQITAPATPDAVKWQGWGTALKPAHEPIVVARKPLIGTVAANVLAHGTGALNIDATRVATDDSLDGGAYIQNGARAVSASLSPTGMNRAGATVDAEFVQPAGRWPANVLLDGDAAAELDAQSGTLTSGANPTSRGSDKLRDAYGDFAGQAECVPARGADSGGASRFFPTFRYEAKAPTSERPRTGDGPTAGSAANVCALCGRQDLSGSRCVCPEPQWVPRAGNESVMLDKKKIRECNVCGTRAKPGHYIGGDTRPWPSCGHEDWQWVKEHRAGADVATAHPTVKPLDLMRWLIRLITPPGGLVLDPFAGSGTTGEAAIVEGFRAILIEREPTYLPLIIGRLSKPIEPVLDFGAL